MALKLRKGLADILEKEQTGAQEAEEYAPPQVEESAAPAPARSVKDQQEKLEWSDHLIQALVEAPEDVAAKLVTCIDREILIKALQQKDNPYFKVMLLLLNK
jgi:hypothetical protein